MTSTISVLWDVSSSIWRQFESIWKPTQYNNFAVQNTTDIFALHSYRNVILFEVLEKSSNFGSMFPGRVRWYSTMLYLEDRMLILSFSFASSPHFFLNPHFPSTFFTWLRQCVAQPTNQCSVQPHIGHRLVFIWWRSVIADCPIIYCLLLSRLYLNILSY
jgi:hypothetical protein